ncbi:hypothetical protein, partial [Novacetimonas maltaceti]|uniref:hypothetical protein n=1 Tax=Novacetimonas maltaceti TaxID=1203393 RepID=UPI001ABEF5D7
SIFAHWASVSTKRSMQTLNHNHTLLKTIIPNRPQKGGVFQSFLGKSFTRNFFTFLMTGKY